MLHEDINKKILVFFEAGGESAISTYLFMKDLIPTNQMLMVDQDQKVVKMWERMGVPSMLQAEFDEMPKEEVCIAPCSERVCCAQKYKDLLFGGPCDVYSVHNKKLALRLIESRAHTVKAPERYSRIVVRDHITSGSKSLVMPDPDKSIVTEYISGVELEIDYVFQDGVFTIFPVISHFRKNGANFHVTLIGKDHPWYDPLRIATIDVYNALLMNNVGTVQLIAKDDPFCNTARIDQLYFIEAACRLHGSSRVWYHQGFNVFINKATDLNFKEKHVVKYLGS